MRCRLVFRVTGIDTPPKLHAWDLGVLLVTFGLAMGNAETSKSKVWKQIKKKNMEHMVIILLKYGSYADEIEPNWTGQ